MAIVERNPLPRIPLETRQELHEWLAANHASHSGFWLVQWRSSDHGPRISYDDIVEECLIFGWIDSTVQSFDDKLGGLRLTPRKANSVWSAPNKQRLARLEAAGLMQPAGRRAVEIAKANGMFTFLDDVDALIVPADLAAALGDDLPAFEAFSAGRRKQALYWVKSAKRETTRSDRIAKIAEAAQAGESLF
ncbi:MAG: YdeI/OmpD-associated family protein [Candidatus Nanopelagicales bacterium]|jgi:uncharacterized protein YdeI (YjbR/CyaY-like superfamily)|nr:YdeI/OmpD-associated family protein [Candidatus Nanopelagicales bacterium]MCU0297951.1 YdeI/OmpD-associated family protein [Candidatus Nanopelagicales bacterium]